MTWNEQAEMTERSRLRAEKEEEKESLPDIWDCSELSRAPSDPYMTSIATKQKLLCKHTILQASASYTQLTSFITVRTDLSSYVNENKELICIFKTVTKN